VFIGPRFEFQTAVNIETVTEDDGFVFGVDAVFFVVSYDSRDKGYRVTGILSYTGTLCREIFIEVFQKCLC
jgi:hypothetical protein